MPGDARGHYDGAFEFFGVFGNGEVARTCRCSPVLSGVRFADEGVEDQHDAALVFTGKFADDHMAGARGDFPVHEAGAVRWQIIPKRVQLVAATAEIAGHFAAEQRENFVKLIGGFDAWIYQNFKLRIDGARFFKKAEGKARLDSEGVLTIRAAAREIQFDLLARGPQARNVGEEHRAGENFVAQAFFGFAYYAQGKRRPKFLAVAQFEFRHHRLLGEDVLGHIEFQFDAGQHGAGENARHHNSGERAGQNHEQ